MMEALVRFTLKQKILVNLLYIFLTVAGIFAYLALPAERYPDVNMAAITIATDFPGASPADVETLVTQKLEEAIEDIPNIEWINSSSLPESSNIRVKMTDDSDYIKTYNEIRFNILNAKASLPAGADQPKIDNIMMSALVPVVTVNLSSPHENKSLSLLADQLKLAFKRIDGVKKITIAGEFTREFHINLDVEKLNRLGITFNEVANALQDANISVSAGRFRSDKEEYLLKVDEQFSDRDTVVNTLIRRDGDGSFVRLNELITSADYAYRKPRVITAVNGSNSIILNVIKEPSGNSLTIKSSVDRILAEHRELLDKESASITLTQDSSVKINDGMSTLGWNLVIGMILVSLITWFFMGIRNSGLITIGIPFSFLLTLLLMHLTGYSFNELTLFAFVLVSGIIVDDAVVITDNIYRHIQEGKPTQQAIIDGTSEVAMPVVSSTLTTVAAFLPMLIMTGTTGEFFAQIPVVVSYALLASLLEGLFILPLHYLDFGPKKDNLSKLKTDDEIYLIRLIKKCVLYGLAITLNFRKLTLLAVLGLFALSVGLMYVSASGIAPLIKIKFFPEDYAVYFVDITGTANTAIDDINTKAQSVAAEIKKEGPGKVDSTVIMSGLYMNEDYEMVFGSHYSVVIVTLPAKDKIDIADPVTYLEQMREKLNAKFGQDGTVLTIHALKESPPSGKPVNIKIMSGEAVTMVGLADELKRYLIGHPAIGPALLDLTDNRGIQKKVYQFVSKDERIKELNLSKTEVMTFAGGLLDGRYIGKFKAADEELDIKLQLSNDAVVTPEQALSIPYLERADGSVLLGDLVDLKAYHQTSELFRYQGQRTISIKSDLRADGLVSPAYVNSEVKAYFERISHKYPGVVLSIGGEHENTAKSYRSLLFAFLLAVSIAYVVLAAQFQSYSQPIIILFSILFAIIGIVLGVFFTQSLITINSFIAMMGVIGVVINDALVLVEFINKAYASGLSRKAAIDEAIRVRLRPIILTTVTTILGLLPMAMGIPSYSVVWGAMATTFVTGLGVSTLLTLVVVPALWDLLQEHHDKRLRRHDA